MDKTSVKSETAVAQEKFDELVPVLKSPIVTVSNQDDVDFYRGEITVLKEGKKVIEKSRKTISEPLELAKKNLQALFSPMKSKIDIGIGSRESAILTYSRKQAEIARIKEEAIKKEQRRIEAERIEKEEELKKNLPKEEAEKKISELKEEAEVSELSGSLDLAGANAGRAEVKGMVVYYSVEVIDKTKLPMNFLMADEKALNAQAREDKDKFNVPGCKLVRKERIKG